MAIQWDYNEDYIGRYEQWQEQNQGYCKCNMHTGNCLFICNWETQKTATLAMFAADEQHLKNCLANKESKLFNAKDRFVFNTTDNKYQMAKIKKAIALLTGVVTIEIRPKENPIEKYYNTKQEEKRKSVQLTDGLHVYYDSLITKLATDIFVTASRETTNGSYCGYADDLEEKYGLPEGFITKQVADDVVQTIHDMYADQIDSDAYFDEKDKYFDVCLYHAYCTGYIEDDQCVVENNENNN